MDVYDFESENRKRRCGIESSVTIIEVFLVIIIVIIHGKAIYKQNISS